MENPKLQAAQILSLPSFGYYLPNFISIEEEQAILDAIYATPVRKWTVLAHRRLLSLPSQLTGSRKDTLLEARLPGFLLDPIVQRLQDLDVFRHSPHLAPNHCLVNEYHAGQGIMPHEDGPAYYAVTATVSLASHTVLNIYKKTELGERERVPEWRVLQEPRSLLITMADMYKDTLHGIEEIIVDEELKSTRIVNWDLLGDQRTFVDGHATRAKRVSLTYRDVLKVTKLGGALKFMTKK